jgi:hypothetical protein
MYVRRKQATYRTALMLLLIEIRFQAGFNLTEHSRQPHATGSSAKADRGDGVSDAAAYSPRPTAPDE